MKKKIIAVVFVLLIITAITSSVLAEGGVLENIKASMKSAVDAKTDEKITAMNANIQATVDQALSDVKLYQTNRVNAEIDKYINDKLNTIATSEAMNTASNGITTYATQLIGEEKARVDQAIASYLQ